MVLIEAYGGIVPNRSLWFGKSDRYTPFQSMLVLFFASPFLIKKWGWSFYNNFSPQKNSIIQQTHFFWGKKSLLPTQPIGRTAFGLNLDGSLETLLLFPRIIHRACRRQEGVFWEMDFRQNFSLLGGWALTHLNNMLVKKKYLKLVHI